MNHVNKNKKNTKLLPYLDKSKVNKEVNKEQPNTERNFGKDLKNINKNNKTNNNQKDQNQPKLTFKENNQLMTNLSSNNLTTHLKQSFLPVPETVTMIRSTNSGKLNHSTSHSNFNFSSNNKIDKLTDMDKAVKENPQYITDFIIDIFSHILKTEVTF
jgi:hypothetical protein